MLRETLDRRADHPFLATVTAEIYDENQRRLAAHEANSFRGPLKLLPPLEHLWVLCDVRPLAVSASCLLFSRNRHLTLSSLDHYRIPTRVPRSGCAITSSVDAIFFLSKTTLRSTRMWTDPSFASRRAICPSQARRGSLAACVLSSASRSSLADTDVLHVCS